MPYLLTWTDPIDLGAPASDALVEAQVIEQPKLVEVLRRACELLEAGKVMLTIRRPNGSYIDEPEIRGHCEHRSLITD
jgi:hypothetical protein